MRWEALFRDLEARADEAARAELSGEVADRSRREAARIHLGDRLRAATGATVQVGVDGVGRIAGVVARSGPDWLVLASDEGRATEILVAVDAVTWVSGLPALTADPDALSSIESRWTLGYVLRGLARDRANVQIRLRDGEALGGTIDRVGADFAEVAEHAPGEPRRERDVVRTRTLRLAALATITMV